MDVADSLFRADVPAAGLLDLIGRTQVPGEVPSAPVVDGRFSRELASAVVVTETTAAAQVETALVQALIASIAPTATIAPIEPTAEAPVNADGASDAAPESLVSLTSQLQTITAAIDATAGEIAPIVDELPVSDFDDEDSLEPGSEIPETSTWLVAISQTLSTSVAPAADPLVTNQATDAGETSDIGTEEHVSGLPRSPAPETLSRWLSQSAPEQPATPVAAKPVPNQPLTVEPIAASVEAPPPPVVDETLPPDLAQIRAEATPAAAAINTTAIIPPKRPDVDSARPVADESVLAESATVTLAVDEKPSAIPLRPKPKREAESADSDTSTEVTTSGSGLAQGLQTQQMPFDGRVAADRIEVGRSTRSDAATEPVPSALTSESQEVAADTAGDQRLSGAGLRGIAVAGVPNPAAGDVASAGTISPVDPQRFADQLSRYVLQSHDQGQQLSVQVTPPDMGTIVINVRSTAEGFSVQFEASSSSAQQLLTEQLPQLQEALSQLGRPADRLDVIRSESAFGAGMTSDRGTGSGHQQPTQERRETVASRTIEPNPKRPPRDVAPAPTGGPGRMQELNVRI